MIFHSEITFRTYVFGKVSVQFFHIFVIFDSKKKTILKSQTLSFFLFFGHRKKISELSHFSESTNPIFYNQSIICVNQLFFLINLTLKLVAARETLSIHLLFRLD